MPFYQRSNLATALAAVTVALGLAPSPESASIALGGLVIPGRFEILRHDPLVIVDAAHNPQSAHVLAGELRRLFDGDAAIPTLLLGVLDDKDARGIIRELCPLFDRIVVTASSSTRAVPATELASLVAEETGVRPEATHDVRAARELLSGEPIVATGSITVAGEVKGIWC